MTFRTQPSQSDVAATPPSPTPMTRGRGLTITRHFTKPGVHPYEEVEWELRAASIANERGEVVFEQRDVEIPKSWSQTATNVVVSKYFRGALGTPQRECSVKQLIDRVANTIADWGIKDGDFATREDAEHFRAELTAVLLTQRAAFNSPVWFNVGIEKTPQCSACFILSVQDTMESILEWYRTEGMIFKYGSGSGINLSPIRSSSEQLAGGGTASGPVSFMRAADASAGVIKSGGKTRRAAKMVVLNADHPDVKKFILCKWQEEKKAWTLVDAGFDSSIDGEAYSSVFFQNANNSVRVTDEFMRAVLEDRDWPLKAVTTGQPVETVKARDLMRMIAEATWHCGDPGMQFDTTYNDWHTCPNTGRINATNPCFTGDARIYTDKGLIPFKELAERVSLGESFRVFTHDATNPEHPAETVSLTRPSQIMGTGVNEVWRLRFSNGIEVTCTRNHRFFTRNRGMVAAEELRPEDEIPLLNQPIEFSAASLALDMDHAALFASGWGARATKGCKPVRLPSVWTSPLAEYVGYLVGDGYLREAPDSLHRGSTANVVFGNRGDADELIPHFRALFNEWGVEDLQEVDMPNGTVQFRINRKPVVRFLKQLGVAAAKAPSKVVPHTLFKAPKHIIAGFLRGLFTADGCLSDGVKHRYVGLGSVSKQLLAEVQQLLASFGIVSRIYPTRQEGAAFKYTRNDGETVSYVGKQLYDLRISGPSIVRFKEQIGFLSATKQTKLDRLVAGHEFYQVKEVTRLTERSFAGYEPTYNLTEPKNHSYIVNSLAVANCSEYAHLDDSACNLASLNLMKFLDDDGTFRVDDFRHAVRLIILAQDIVVDNSSYPTPKIAETAKAYRQLGLGYANLGALLMSLGIPYDSEAGRAYAATVTALMCGEAYRTSTIIAAQLGSYAGFTKNREPQLRVIQKHRDALQQVNQSLVPELLFRAASEAWNDALRFGAESGVRNSQVTVLAPTGCLTGNSLVVTDRGLMRLNRLGNPKGGQWQEASFQVATDEGPRHATKFYINGRAATRRIRTEAGYEIQGTPNHRVKVVDPISGEHLWRRLDELQAGDVVPMAMDSLIGHPQPVPLPPLSEPYWAGNDEVLAPKTMTPELAEFVGYFLGDGSLHSQGLRLCVAEGDDDVVAHLQGLSKALFNLEPHLTTQTGYVELALHSVALAMWWDACGFAKGDPDGAPEGSHSGKGYQPLIPDAVLATNDPAIYRAFLRGFFEADGTSIEGVPAFCTAHATFAQELMTLLLTLGFPATRKVGHSGWGGETYVARLRNASYNDRFLTEIGFLGQRKRAKIISLSGPWSGNRDHIYMPPALVEELVPVTSPHRDVVLMSGRRYGGIPRQRAVQLLETSHDTRLAQALRSFYDRVEAAEDGGEQPTYDLSVPENVTYLANGFISHNTIGFMMDCDTTGIEPDIALIKYKRLVGGGLLKIVNQTVPRALRRLGYTPEQIEAICRHLDEQETIEGAPHLKEEHLPVFDCAFKPIKGTRSIHYMGHVRMMGAAQPFISGSISKTVNVPAEATVDDILQAYLESWRLGVKAIAIYRDGSKRVQPLSTGLKAEKPSAESAPSAETAPPAIEERIVYKPVRRYLQDERQAITHKFSIAGHDGYVTVGLYEDGQPGEIFIVMSKEGTVISGLLDAFATAISLALQFGVPLEALVKKYSHMRFEPAGITSNPQIRFASSILDYVFRWMALKFLPPEKQPQPEAPSLAEPTTSPKPSAQTLSVAGETHDRAFEGQVDAPPCPDCGSMMVRSGNCYKCFNCGSTSGCS